MNAQLSEKYVELYNYAILKIFSPETMELLFGKNIESSIGHWKMTFPLKDINTYPECTQRKILYEVCEPLFEQKRIFLEFIQKNFPELTNQGPENVAKLLDIEKKVKDFIKKMEVTSDTSKSIIQIEVTLHDIIGNFSTTSFGSLHCLSEKLFLAILFAIKKKVNVFELKRGYHLKFKFAKSSFGKSGLQKSSVICSNDKSITESTDPVDDTKNFFELGLLELNNAVKKQEVKMNKQAAAEGAAEAAKAKAAAEATSTPGAGAAMEAPTDAALTPVQPVAVLGNEAPPDAALGDNTTEEEISQIPPPPPMPVEAQVEAPSATMLGDGLYNKHNQNLPSRNDLANDETIKTYRTKILSEFDQFTTTELNKDKICELLLISCNGSKLEQFKKLLFFREIFASEYCVMSNPKYCHTIYMKLTNEIEKLQSSLFSSGGGSKSRRRHRRHAHKTRRGRSRKPKSKSKTHRRRRHSRIRKHKKNTYTRRR
jgi:hypothetical protein